MKQKPLSTAAKAALHEVLLQAALRAERGNEARSSDRRAREIAIRGDELARQS